MRAQPSFHVALCVCVCIDASDCFERSLSSERQQQFSIKVINPHVIIAPKPKIARYKHISIVSKVIV